MTTTPALELRNLRMGFGAGPDVLAGVDLTIHRGEFVAVLGPSGCGKSTILNAVAGLLPVREGSVHFCGAEVTGINTRVGYMTQGDTLLPWRTVRDNVAMPLKFRRVSASERRQRVDRLLEMLDLRDAASKYPSQLSGGMQRRALLARSMVYEPDMLLMDEPFAALDAQLREQMHQELLTRVAGRNQTVTFITHDLDEAVILADRVVVIGGRPGHVIDVVDIPLGSNRDVRSLRYSQEFAQLTQSLHRVLDQARSTHHDLKVSA